MYKEEAAGLGSDTNLRPKVLLFLITVAFADWFNEVLTGHILAPSDLIHARSHRTASGIPRVLDHVCDRGFSAGPTSFEKKVPACKRNGNPCGLAHHCAVAETQNLCGPP